MRPASFKVDLPPMIGVTGDLAHPLQLCASMDAQMIYILLDEFFAQTAEEADRDDILFLHENLLAYGVQVSESDVWALVQVYYALDPKVRNDLTFDAGEFAVNYLVDHSAMSDRK